MTDPRGTYAIRMTVNRRPGWKVTCLQPRRAWVVFRYNASGRVDFVTFAPTWATAVAIIGRLRQMDPTMMRGTITTTMLDSARDHIGVRFL